MWRSQYGAPPIERPVRGLEELSPPGSMTRSSASSPSTVSLRSSSSYSSRSPSPVFKTQTNGAGWGHCARRGSNRSQCYSRALTCALRCPGEVEKPGSYLGEPSTPNHPRAPTPTRSFMPLDAPLLASGGLSNAHARARRAPHAARPCRPSPTLVRRSVWARHPRSRSTRRSCCTDPRRSR